MRGYDPLRPCPKLHDYWARTGRCCHILRHHAAILAESLVARVTPTYAQPDDPIAIETARSAAIDLDMDFPNL